MPWLQSVLCAVFMQSSYYRETFYMNDEGDILFIQCKMSQMA
jgi:hypothetical protein